MPFPSNRGFLLQALTEVCPKMTANSGGRKKNPPPIMLSIPKIIEVTANPEVLLGVRGAVPW